MKQGFVSVNPLRFVTGPKTKKPLPTFVKEKDMEELLDGDGFDEDFEGVRDRLVLEMLYDTGVRRSELVGLQDTDIDYDAMLIRVTGKRNKQRLEAVTGQVAQAEQNLEDAKAATAKQKKKLESLQKETKAAKTIALTVQDIEVMGKKATFGNNITLTPDECDTLKRYAVNGIIANADNKRLKEKLASAEKTVSIWKQRYEAVNEKYMELKQKAQPFLDALEIASEKVRAFINSILIRGKQTQEHEHPARKRGQDMEL
jgi:hypothetical protein